MVEIDLVGVMYIWNIDLNALSTVNLVMCVGISGADSSVPVRGVLISDESLRVCGVCVVQWSFTSTLHTYLHTVRAQGTSG